MRRKNLKELKAKIIGKNITIKKLENVITSYAETLSAERIQHRKRIESLEIENYNLEDTLTEANKKKWYQFKQVG